ncbi:MAG TPA: MBL fold metallo-hydrolase [Bacillota bacterium]|nr:MBL fold metallo-hydrolase [Bacillota bacterium]HPF42521.1 MBL fold metallo-hydrolase [Bacillota bacterium]HPJ85995.1 MBL fold metallo-hydrolase [Bacillota bacterium]HPQ61984.1 MBL fold metallo-hydrolase [Bacillota bacterium]HRX92116.1 MBL fold metallo-hydrolase [Candidatus Izemoplasmatales bacterium]
MTHQRIYDNIALQNTYVLQKKSAAIVIDPGFNGNEAVNCLKESGAIEVAVFLTHGHFDHIRDLPVILEAFPKSRVYIQENDLQFLYDERLSYARAFHSHFSLPKEQTVETFGMQGELVFEDIVIRYLNTPGHTAGSASLYIDERLYSGDTLFSDGIGRTDLYTGSMASMNKSLKLLITSFSRKTLVCPGHGESKRLGEIIENNPYLP